MKELLNVLYYLQNNDLNGNYMEILDEIEGGELTITQAKQECINILNRWKEENLSPTNYISHNRIEELINSLQ